MKIVEFARIINNFLFLTILFIINRYFYCEKTKK